MLRKLYRVVSLLVVCQLVFPWVLFAAPVGEFVSVVGDVTLTRAGKVYKAIPKSAIEAKDLIATGKNASAKLLFTDESTINLSQSTKFEIKEFMMKDKTRTGSFFVSLGKVTADVKKFIGGGSTFEMRSPTAVAGVRGTGFEFAVAMVGSQLATTVTCTAGALSVSAISAAGAVISTATIVAGQAAVITSTGITVSAAATAAATGAATTTGTTVTTATGTGTVTTTTAAGTTAATTTTATTAAGAAGTAGAAGAGAAAGTATVAGVGAGTVAAAAVATAAVAAAVVSSTSSDKPAPATHTTTTHH